MTRNRFSGTYGKWRKMIMTANEYFVLIIFIIEVIIFLALYANDMILQSLPVYLFRFVALPTGCNVLILMCSKTILARTNPNKFNINYIPVVAMEMIALILSMTHYIFSVTLSSLCFPIFITVIFNDKKMTRRIMNFSLVLLFFAMLFRFLDPLAPANDIYLIPECAVAAMIIISTNILSNILIRFQSEKDKVIEEANKGRVVMQDRIDRDQKTGLYSATVLFDSLNTAIMEAEENKLCLCVIDIDDFKMVNDTYGHLAGDKVIMRLADIMSRYESAELLPTRFGGEEFAIICKLDIEESYECAETIRNLFFAQRYGFLDKRVSISCGVSEWSVGMSSEMLFERADAAMYKAKQAGKNVVKIYSDYTEDNICSE